MEDSYSSTPLPAGEAGFVHPSPTEDGYTSYWNNRELLLDIRNRLSTLEDETSKILERCDDMDRRLAKVQRYINNG